MEKEQQQLLEREKHNILKFQETELEQLKEELERKFIHDKAEDALTFKI